MFAQNLVFLALLAASAAQSGKRKMLKMVSLFNSPNTSVFTGILRRIQGDWIVPDAIVYEDTDGVEVEESVWPVNPPEVHGSVMEDQNLLITAEPNVLVEEGELLTI